MVCLIKKILYKKNYRHKTYIKLLKVKDTKIGSRETTFSRRDDITTNMARMCLWSIGNDVEIIKGVTTLKSWI